MSRTLPRVWSRGQAGFTLLELLIALTLLGLLTILMAGEIRFGLRVWERATVHTGNLEEIQLAHNFLRQQLSQAYPLTTSQKNVQPVDRRIDFVGTQDRLRFVVVAPERFGIGSFQILTLERVTVDGRANLQVSWRPYHLGTDRVVTEGELHSSMLLHDVAAITFGYFGAMEPEEPASWSDRWINPVRLPQLVRLDIRFAEDGRFWPELIVAPQMGQH